jgi:hypothetical protein
MNAEVLVDAVFVRFEWIETKRRYYMYLC